MKLFFYCAALGKVRNIKPAFFSDEKVGRVRPLARYLFLGSFSLADDNGVFRAHASYVKSRVFCYDDDITIQQVAEWLYELTCHGLLVPVEYNREKYYIIRNFRKHQKIDNRFISEVIPIQIVDEALAKWNADSCAKSTETPQISHKITDSSANTTREKESKIPPKELHLAKKTNQAKNFDTSYIEDHMRASFEKWLHYKAERNQRYKPIGMRACYNKLVELSRNDGDIAMQIVDQSIANNYSGLFQLKGETANSAAANPKLYTLLNYEEMCREIQKNGTSTEDYAPIRVNGKQKPLWVRKVDKARFKIPDFIALDGAT